MTRRGHPPSGPGPPFARACATALLAALAAVSCGKRGPPLPPLRKNPQPVEGLQARQRASTVELSFTAPRLTLDGERLPVLDVEILYGFRHGVALREIAERRSLKAAPGEALVETWPLPDPGTPLRFAVRSRANGKASPLSAELVHDAVEPPPAPSDLVAAVEPTGVRLFWSECVPTTADPWIEPLLLSEPLARALAELSAFTRGEPPPADAPGEGSVDPELDSADAALEQPGAAGPEAAEAPSGAAAEDRPPWPQRPGPAADGERPPGSPGAPAGGAGPPAATPEPRPTPPSSGVTLYRRVGTAEYQPLSSAALPGGTYLDAAVEPGESYCYRARSVLSGATSVEGGDSAEVCVAHRDVGVPDPPSGLTPLRLEDGRIELSWSTSVSRDVERYRIYRRVGTGPAQALADVPADARRWVDPEPALGRLNSYSVSALDAAGNESPATSEGRVDLR